MEILFSISYQCFPLFLGPGIFSGLLQLPESTVPLVLAAGAALPVRLLLALLWPLTICLLAPKPVSSGCPASICHLLVCHRSLNCGEYHHFASSYTEDTRIKAVLNPMKIFDVTRVLTLWVNRISLIQTLHSSFGEKYNCYSINMAQYRELLSGI